MSVLVFEHTDTVGSDRLGQTLSDYGHRLNVIRIHENDPVPDDIDNVDAIISCGGPQSATDDALPWLEPQMQLLRQAAECDIPIVGLCLGSQILAKALGGEVKQMVDGIEFGWNHVRLTPIGREDVIFTGIGWDSTQFHHHRDHVSELPPGARLLAGSGRCKVQAWAHGLRTYGIQFHPEITTQTIERWAHTEPEALEEAGLTWPELQEQTQSHYPTFERISSRLFESIALFLMPVDRRYKGLVKDLHH